MISLAGFRMVLDKLTRNGKDRLIIRYDDKGNIASWTYLPKGQGRPPNGGQGASVETMRAYVKTLNAKPKNPPTPPRARKKSA